MLCLLRIAQAATATASTAGTTSGLSLGEWLALVAGGLTLAGVIYRAGGAVAKTSSIEKMVAAELQAINKSIDRISEYMERSEQDTQKVRLEYTIWRENISGRVQRLEGDGPVYVHKRASDA